MAKKAKKADTASVLDQLAAYSPPWEEPVKEEKEEKADTGLVERLAKAEAELEAMRRQQVYSGFQSAPQTVAQTAAPKKDPTQVDLENMPDYVTETKEFTSELAKRISAASDAKLMALQAEQRAESDRERLANSLWSGFQQSHPQWAEHEMLVESAASRVSQSLQAKGVNVVALMKSQPDVFYNEVAGMLEKKYPQLKGGAKTESEDNEDDGPGEAVVFGGSPGKPSGGEKVLSSEDENQRWLREVTEMQYKKGLK